MVVLSINVFSLINFFLATDADKIGKRISVI